MRLGICLASALMLASLVAAETPAHVVVLADGRTVASLTRPMCAFGQVRYTDTEGRPQVLPDSRVDVKATREHPSNQGAAQPPARTTLNVLGEGDAPAGMPALARARPPVTVYSATWCPHCKHLKEWLARNGIPANIIEVDTLSPAAQAAAGKQMAALAGGRASYPTVQVGSAVSVGFNEAWLSSQLGLSSNRRSATAGTRR